MALFRVDFSGRGELAERQQKLAQMLSRLQKISEGQNHKLASDVRNILLAQTMQEHVMILLMLVILAVILSLS